MTPEQRKVRNALEREYLAELHMRRLRVACPTCGAERFASCLHQDGPRRGQAMAGVHGDRAFEANRQGHVKGPVYWRHHRK
jgi:phage terminase large subunit GpA-like protein